jgi:hypothetical protein
MMSESRPATHTTPTLPPDKVEAQITRALKRHLAHPQAQPTAFTRLWSGANAQATNRTSAAHFRWQPFALAAAVTMTLALLFNPITNDPSVPTPLSVESSPSDALMHALVTSTTWEAPSDKLLRSSLALQVWGLPELGRQQDQLLEKLL